MHLKNVIIWAKLKLFVRHTQIHTLSNMSHNSAGVEFITPLIKKTDATVVENNVAQGYLVLESDAIPHIEGFEQETKSQDSQMLLNEAAGPRVDVWVKITRIVFMANAALSCLIVTGMLPYEFLTIEERPNTVIYMCIGCALASLTFYITMIACRRAWFALSLLVAWGFTYYAVVICIAGIMRDLSPLQFGMITAVQSLAVIVYSITSPANVDPLRAFYAMAAVGVMGWAVGLYAFITQRDWIPAIILLVATFASAAYSAVEIHFVTRFNLSKKDCIEAVICFYGDPVIQAYKKIAQISRSQSEGDL